MTVVTAATAPSTLNSSGLAYVVDRRLENRLHVLARGHRRVLEDLDGTEALGERADRRDDRAVAIPDVRGRDVGGDPFSVS